MHRVRIGIIGLASVFLLVLLAAALYSLFGDKQPAPSAANMSAAIANGSEAPREPLAELGVAPGNNQPDVNTTAPATAPPAAMPAAAPSPAASSIVTAPAAGPTAVPSGSPTPPR